MNSSQGGCLNEGVAPPGAPSPVGGSETVIHFIRVALSLGWDRQGKPFVQPLAIREEDLKGKKNKSVSTYRVPLTAPGELYRRGCDLNNQHEWSNDPVAAYASVQALRQLLDTLSPNWRLVCVNADPTTATDDHLGACPTHASIVRSDPKPGDKLRMQWLLVQSAVARAFSGRVEHLSGTIPPQV